MWHFLLCGCVCAALSCDCLARPDASIIQSVYDSEAANGSPLHDRDLRVIGASCNIAAEGEYLCQVTFLSNADPNKRLYFDIVSIDQTYHGWKLRSGLCRR